MDFLELHKGTDSDCFSSASQNCVDAFCQKASDGNLKDRNFKIPLEYKEAPFIDCKNHCATKSLSVDVEITMTLTEGQRRCFFKV